MAIDIELEFSVYALMILHLFAIFYALPSLLWVFKGNCQASLLMKSFIFSLGFIKNKWFYTWNICHKLDNEKEGSDIWCPFTPCYLMLLQNKWSYPRLLCNRPIKWQISLRGFVNVSSKTNFFVHLLKLSRPVQLNSPVREQWAPWYE